MLEVPVDIGTGPPVVVLHGYAMRPDTYRRPGRSLGVPLPGGDPRPLRLPGTVALPDVLDRFTATLDGLGLDKVTLLGHSFGGGIELGFASRFPGRVVELVFSDTLAVSREWGLADEAMRHPLGLARPGHADRGGRVRAFVDHASPSARRRRPGGVSPVIGTARPKCAPEPGIRAHVLWANRDSILSRRDGERFARELGASFTVASAPDGRPIDHDWMFQEPDLFFSHLEGLKLDALAP